MEYLAVVVFEVLIFPGFFVVAFVVVGGTVSLAKPLSVEGLGAIVMGAPPLMDAANPGPEAVNVRVVLGLGRINSERGSLN